MTTIKTLSGDYCAGMKRDNAKCKTDFDRVDLLDGKKTGTLSNIDICNERDREAEAMARTKSYDTGVAVGCAVTAMCTAETGVGLIAGALGAIVFGTLAFFESDGSKEKEETQKYRNKLNLTM